jgi:hypothetical protein
MQIPITNYDVTLRDLLETIFGSIIIIFGLIGSIVFANIIIGLVKDKNKYIDNRKINIFLLCCHIIFILLFIMLIRYISLEIISNKLILESIFSFFGPTIAMSSLYFGYNIKSILNYP